jgi:hypothetical protein
MTRYFKVLNEDGTPCNGGSGKWNLPAQNPDGSWTPGEWMPKLTDLVPCEHGYHLCREADLVQWLGLTIWEAEHRGEMLVTDDKVVVGQARLLRQHTNWNERTARLFAVWCAREALKLVPNPDPRSVNACDVGERFANGGATKEELAAARAAAWDAAWDAARARYSEWLEASFAALAPAEEGAA